METNECSKCPNFSACDRINYEDNGKDNFCPTTDTVEVVE